MKAVKEIVTKTETQIDVPEGVYYFASVNQYEEEVVKRVTIKPKDEYDVLTVSIQLDNESIKRYSGYYDFDYSTERLFTRDRGVRIIDEAFFNLQFKEALHVLNAL